MDKEMEHKPDNHFENTEAIIPSLESERINFRHLKCLTYSSTYFLSRDMLIFRMY